MAGAGGRRWQVWVDTGGTFTDALAVSPSGETLREKVLSSSALRGRVAAVEGRRLRVAGLPRDLPEDFFAGWRLASLEGERPEEQRSVPIAGSRGEVELELGADPAADWTAGTRIELHSPEEAPVVAARLLTGTPAGEPLPPLAMRLATTRGTNALLERRGTPTALFVTRGFGDLLVIGDQRRPELFTLAIDKPRPFYERVIEVDERLAAGGEVLRPLDPAALAEAVGEALAVGCEAAAVAFLHSYRNPEPEREAAEALRRAGFRHVALSAELAPLIGILPRVQTAVVDAYLSRVLEDYLDRVAAALGPGSTLHVMTSAGGLVRRDTYRAKDSLLSGPAGGVVGAGRAGERSGLGPVIAFDMGGTSTDVSRHDGEPEYVFEQRVGDATLASTALAIETVAAGGGSICGFDGAAFTVGPESAGADPGPACYGAGGPLTLTDVNLLLGRIDPERFGIPLTPEAAERALDTLLAGAAEATGAVLHREEVLAGLLRIADERMAEAIRRISVRRGYAPSDHALVAFGGAGGQHACAVAEVLGIDTVLVPEDAGLLSALGLGAAVVERFAERQVLLPLADTAGELVGWMEEMGRTARREVAAELIDGELADGESGPAAEIRVRRGLAELRWVGQESTIEVDLPVGDGADDRGEERAASDGSLVETLAERFRRLYSERYGYLPEGRDVELVSLRLVASSTAGLDGPARDGAATDGAATGGAATGGAATGGVGEGAGGGDAATASRRAWFPGGWRDVPVHDRGALPRGTEVSGPALVFERHCATVLPPGWRLTVDRAGALLVERALRVERSEETA